MTHLYRLAVALPFAGMVACLTCLGAAAQTPPADAASAPASAPGRTDLSISDRVKRDAASPLYWIRLNAQKNDSAPAKAAPRIAEIRPVPRPTPAPAPSTQPGGGDSAAPAPVAGNSATGARSEGAGGAGIASAGSPVATGAAATGASASPATSSNEATAVLAAPAPLSAPGPATSVAGMAGAGMVAPAASSAAEAARAAAVPEPEEPLELVKAEEPEFPALVVRKMRKGSVQVRFDVMPDGSVANAAVVETSSRALNESALDAVRAWQFKPVPSQRSAVVDLGFDLDG